MRFSIMEDMENKNQEFFFNKIKEKIKETKHGEEGVYNIEGHETDFNLFQPFDQEGYRIISTHIIFGTESGNSEEKGVYITYSEGDLFNNEYRFAYKFDIPSDFCLVGSEHSKRPVDQIIMQGSMMEHFGISLKGFNTKEIVFNFKGMNREVVIDKLKIKTRIGFENVSFGAVSFRDGIVDLGNTHNSFYFLFEKFEYFRFDGDIVFDSMSEHNDYRITLSLYNALKEKNDFSAASDCYYKLFLPKYRSLSSTSRGNRMILAVNDFISGNRTNILKTIGWLSVLTILTASFSWFWGKEFLYTMMPGGILRLMTESSFTVFSNLIRFSPPGWFLNSLLRNNSDVKAVC